MFLGRRRVGVWRPVGSSAQGPASAVRSWPDLRWVVASAAPAWPAPGLASMGPRVADRVPRGPSLAPRRRLAGPAQGLAGQHRLGGAQTARGGAIILASPKYQTSELEFGPSLA